MVVEQPLNRPTGKAKPSGDIYLFNTLNNLFVCKNVKKTLQSRKKLASKKSVTLDTPDISD